MGADTLVERLVGFIACPDPDPELFDVLALDVFQYQARHNAPFARLLRARGRTVRTVRHWTDIPPVPIDAFKSHLLTCAPVEQAEAVFMTSGTTRGAQRGRNVHPTLRVYNASMRTGFRAAFMAGVERLRMAILFPPPSLLPNSSLAHYLELARASFGTPDSLHVVDTRGLNVQALLRWLEDAEAGGEPCALLGATFSFVHVMDALQQSGRRFRLPAGSRLFDTGGFKGQSRELDPDSFYNGLSETFAVPRECCINMYGLTELSSQFYDRGNATSPALKRGPHWVRTRVVDPLTGHPVASGERGVLAHWDLAQFNSVCAVLTEDAGIASEDGFILLGRVSGAQAQGCSLALDQFLAAVGGNAP